MTKSTVRLTPRMKRTLTRARQLARARGHDYLGTEHILLALLDDPAGIAGGVLARLGNAAAIRNEVIEIMEGDGYARTTHDGLWCH